jgi:hypothetical protein
MTRSKQYEVALTGAVLRNEMYTAIVNCTAVLPTLSSIVTG